MEFMTHRTAEKIPIQKIYITGSRPGELIIMFFKQLYKNKSFRDKTLRLVFFCFVFYDECGTCGG